MLGTEVLLLVLGGVLVGGSFLAILTAVAREPTRAPIDEAATTETGEAPGAAVFGAAAERAGSEGDRVVIFIEHYLRKERLAAKQFVESPSADALHRQTAGHGNR